MVGNGVFEALKVTDAGAVRRSSGIWRGSPVRPRALGLPDPTTTLVRAGIAAVIEGRAYDFGKIRITYTGGPGPLGSQAPYGPPTLVVAADAAELARADGGGRHLALDPQRARRAGRGEVDVVRRERPRSRLRPRA